MIDEYDDDFDPYAGVSEAGLKRRLARAERSISRIGNFFVLVWLACLVYAFRQELIDMLTALGDLGRG